MKNTGFLIICCFLGAAVAVANGQTVACDEAQPKVYSHGGGEGCEQSARPRYSDEEMRKSDERVNVWLTPAFASNEDKDQKKYFTDYALMLDSLDVKISPIASFNTVSSDRLRRPVIFFPNKYFLDNTSGVLGATICGPVLEADTKEALIVYPVLLEAMNPEKMIESEMAAATENDGIDVTPYITRMSGSQAPGASNADEVILYEFDMKEPLLDDYSHAVGVVMNKKGHYPMGFKIVLNEKGRGKKDDYVKLLLENVKYGDDPLERCLELEQRQLLNTGPEKFPLRRVPLGCGHGEVRI